MRSIRILVEFKGHKFPDKPAGDPDKAAERYIREDGINGFCSDLGGALNYKRISESVLDATVTFDRYHALGDEGNFKETADDFVTEMMVYDFALALSGEVTSVTEVDIPPPVTKQGKAMVFPVK